MNFEHDEFENMDLDDDIILDQDEEEAPKHCCCGCENCLI